MTALADDLSARVVAAFETHADPERAAPMRAYMRDQFPFLGIASVPRTKLLREALAGTPEPREQDVTAFARLMWQRSEREYQYAATWYLRRHAKRLTPAALPVAAELITTKSWWDTVDELAHHTVGSLVRRYPELSADMDRWIDDPNLWIARTAILHQNGWKADTDPDRLFRYCLRRADHRDFFIRKAIGWALRDYSKVDEAAVRRFVADHHDELSGLSRTEALKWLARRESRAAPSGGPD